MIPVKKASKRATRELNSAFISESKGIDVTRIYCGSYLTSLDMPGFSVTLLKPGIETLHWLGELIRSD